MKRNWSPLTHEIYRRLRAEKLTNPHLTTVHVGVAVSGGADSVALLAVLNDIKTSLGLNLEVLHVHHGPGKNEKYRDRAEKFVRRQAKLWNLPFHTVKSSELLKSEQSLRNFRRQAFLTWMKDLQLEWVATGHHNQDLLETRILRMLRGTGARGFSAIQSRQAPWLRPFLHLSPEVLRSELIERRLEWLEDDSNFDPRFLRNWVRHHWLPALERRSPGAVDRWGATLSTLAESLKEPAAIVSNLWVNQNTLSRPLYLQLSPSQQRQALAQLFWRLKSTNYSQAQIEEVRKRLDNPRNVHTFTVSSLDWRVNAEQIFVGPRRRELSTEV